MNQKGRGQAANLQKQAGVLRSVFDARAVRDVLKVNVPHPYLDLLHLLTDSLTDLSSVTGIQIFPHFP